MSYLNEIAPKMVRYRLARQGLARPGTPMNLTFSVTNVCQSRCQTCNIWRIYRDAPEDRSQELTLDEIDRIFASMGHVYIFNISGGEPFLRPDLPEIIASACRHLTPGIIHIPTNALARRRIKQNTVKILKILGDHYPSVQLTIKPSLDHIGQKHDEIRGVPGNFEKVLEIFEWLKSCRNLYSNLHVELGTVISRWNVADVEEIAGYVGRLGTDSYRNEIAEQRAEMFNRQNDITPDPQAYARAIRYFTDQLSGTIGDRPLFQRITQAFRLEYYRLAIRIMTENRQVIPCYAGISNAHLTPLGEVWACCTLGYDKPMGNLREEGYDFKRLWNSPRAEQVRRKIARRSCACPLANQAYSNMLLHGPSVLKVLRRIVAGR